MNLRNKLAFFIALNSYVELITRGTSPLSLPDAIANSLSYVKAFGGTEQRNLPDGYIERQFIYMMDGSYLLTDIVPTYDGKIEMDFQTTSFTSYASFLGGRSQTNQGAGLNFGYVNNVWVVDGFTTGSRYISSVAPATNTRYKFIFDNQVATMTSGNSTLFTNTFTGTESNGLALAINGFNNNGSVVNNNNGIYLYSFKVWNAQSELIADYVPAVQKGTVPVVGFYDTVSKTFKTATAGTFAAGGEAVPTPDAPMDIVTNNGVLKLLESATGITTQAGTPTPTNPIPLVSYQNGSLILRSVGEYADTYSASTQAVSRKIAVVTFTGREVWSIYGGAYFSRGYPDRVTGPNTPVLCTHYPNDASAPKYVSANGTKRIVFSDSGFENVEDFTAWLAEQYAAGTPVTIYYPLATETTETAGSFVYADGTVETIVSRGANLFNKNSYEEITAYVNANTGVLTQGTTQKCAVIPCEPNTTYIIANRTTSAWGSFADKTIGSVVTAFVTTDNVLTTGANDRYLIGLVRTTDGTYDYRDTLDVSVYGGTATAETLLKVGDYQDVQSIIDGVVNRQLGVFVLDGTESWSYSAGYSEVGVNACFYIPQAVPTIPILPQTGDSVECLCSHFRWGSRNEIYNNKTPIVGAITGGSGEERVGISITLRVPLSVANTSVTNFKKWLADQYSAGTPVIVIYPLATPTTESVAGQTLQVTDGDNVLEITQASLTGLELEAKYKKRK